MDLNRDVREVLQSFQSHGGETQMSSNSGVWKEDQEVFSSLAVEWTQEWPYPSPSVSPL